MPPLLTIASVIKPPAHGFDKTVASVQREFAGATDLEFLIKVKGEARDFVFESDLDARVICSPDSGVFDGMNQALAAATGEWVLFLNAGDWLEPGFADAFRAAVAAHPQAEFLCFDGHTVDAEDGRAFVRAVPQSLSFGSFLKKTPVLHPCLVVRTSVHRELPYETDLHLAADFSLMVRLVCGAWRGVVVGAFGACMISGGISNQSRLLSKWQATRALIRHGGATPFKRVRALLSYVRFLALYVAIYGFVRRIPPLRRGLIRLRARASQ